MNVVKQLVEAYQSAIRETQFVYAVDQIELNIEPSESTLRYRVIGTGRVSSPQLIEDVYENDALLFAFKPSDIKLISTTAMLLKNPPSQYRLEHIDIIGSYVTFYAHQSKESLKLSLTTLTQKDDLVKKLDAMSAYQLGFATAILADKADK